MVSTNTPEMPDFSAFSTTQLNALMQTEVETQIQKMLPVNPPVTPALSPLLNLSAHKALLSNLSRLTY